MSAGENTHGTRSWLWIAVVAFLIGMLAIAAACGDDDDSGGGDDSGGDGPTATQPADADGDGGDDADDDSGDGDGGDTLQDLSDLAANYEGATGVATFTFSTDGEEASWIYYFDGESSRVDIQAEDGAFISISTPDESYLCTESDGEGLCFSGDGGGAFTNPFLPLFDQYASSDAIFTYLDLFTDVDVEKSSEDIAGVDTDCFTASGDFGSESGTIKWCFSETGVLLLSQYDFEGSSFEMRATDFTSEVPGDAFEPPYQLTSFGG